MSLTSHKLYNMTNGEITSRLRKLMKAETQDAFITDRFIYSVVSKHLAWLLRREDNTMKLIRMVTAYESLDLVDLIEVDKVIAGCSGIKSNCIIKRTEDRIPDLHQGYFGPLIRSVASLDGSEQVYPTTAIQYTKLANSKNFKYNKTKYYWIADGYLYFPNIDWDAVTVDGIFKDDISDYKCEECNKGGNCKSMQEKVFPAPEYLLGELENFARQELLGLYQLPPDLANDKQSLTRG